MAALAAVVSGSVLADESVVLIKSDMKGIALITLETTLGWGGRWFLTGDYEGKVAVLSERILAAGGADGGKSLQVFEVKMLTGEGVDVVFEERRPFDSLDTPPRRYVKFRIEK